MMRDERAVLVDIREAYVRRTWPVRGALPRPLGLLLADDSGLPRDRPVLVVSHAGEQSRFAAAVLEERGFHAFAVEGGALAMEPHAAP